jgi:hypothetical protein
MTQTAAQIFAALCLGVVVFQLCLIGGAPWGHLTQGGFHPGKLPIPQPDRSRRFGLPDAGHGGSNPVGGWGLAKLAALDRLGTLGLTVLSAGMNLATPSRSERLLWGPVTLTMLGLAAVVMAQL